MIFILKVVELICADCEYDIEELKEQVYRQTKEQLGAAHPDTISIMNNLAISYRFYGEEQKALEIEEQMEQKFQRFLD